MKKKISLLMGMVIVLSMVFIACGGEKKVEVEPQEPSNINQIDNKENWEQENKVVIVKESWYPYVGKEDGEKGATIEIAEKAFEKFGVEVEFRNMNWERAINEVANGNANAIVADIWEVVDKFITSEQYEELVQAYIDEGEYEDMFIKHLNKIIGKEPVGNTEISFIVKKGNEFEYNSVEDIKDMKFGAIANYDYDYGVTEYVAEGGPNIVIAENEVNLINMLESDRVEVISENIHVFNARLKEMGLSPEDFSEIIIPESMALLYLCFSPMLESSPKYIEMLDKGIRELRESGELKEILDKYGLSDWDEETFGEFDNYYDFFIDEYFWYLEEYINETKGEEE